MHGHGQIIRRVITILILGAAALAGVLLTTATSAFAATTGTFVLRGSIVGGITTIQTGQTLTFVFTEANHTTAGAFEDVVLRKTANVSVTALTCVVPGGVAINTDGFSCEPGFVKPGQHASLVVTTTVTGASGVASARVCLNNEGTGVVGPCKTRSATIAGSAARAKLPPAA